MDFWSIFNEVKETFMQSDVSDYRGHLALQVNMTGEGEGKFYAELSDGVLKVEPYEYFDRDVLFTISTKDFLMQKAPIRTPFAFSRDKLYINFQI